MENKLKQWQPHLIALGLFILIPVIYFWPVVTGKSLEQSDIIHYMGVSKEIADFRTKFHMEPLWTNALFCGMPAYQVSTLYAANLMQYIFLIVAHTIAIPLGTVFFAFLCILYTYEGNESRFMGCYYRLFGLRDFLLSFLSFLL